MDDLEEIGYAVSVKKPLGVVFGENDAPYNGLVVDDVEPGLNGGAAGIKVGDQLLAVNGQVVLGGDFDSTMDLLVVADDLDLMLYKGPVGSLFTILNNRNLSPEALEDDQDTEEVVMDENYESPVQINVEDFEDKPLSAGDFVKAFKKVTASADKKEKKEKKKGGIFGGMFGAEAIQLDGDDANTLK